MQENCTANINPHGLKKIIPCTTVYLLVEALNIFLI